MKKFIPLICAIPIYLSSCHSGEDLASSLNTAERNNTIQHAQREVAIPTDEIVTLPEQFNGIWHSSKKLSSGEQVDYRYHFNGADLIYEVNRNSKFDLRFEGKAVQFNPETGHVVCQLTHSVGEEGDFIDYKYQTGYYYISFYVRADDDNELLIDGPGNLTVSKDGIYQFDNLEREYMACISGQ